MTVEWRCPKSHERMIFFPASERTGDAFYLCPASRLRYRVDQGVPVFLVDEAEELAAEEVAHWVNRARELGLQVP